MLDDRHEVARVLVRIRWAANRNAMVLVLLLLVLVHPTIFALPEASVTACAADAAGALPRPSVAKGVARNLPAVVSVVVLRQRRDPFEELTGPESFQSLAGLPLASAGNPAQRVPPLERSFSSGFIAHPDGQVLTSAHAVYDAQEVWVLTADGKRFPAVVVGFERRTDVAVLKISGSRLPVVDFAPTISLCAGEPIAAVGAPFGLENSVTAGVISAFPRYLPGGSAIPWIQTDVALNPGSSGGPVFNADGMVIGMSAAIYSSTGVFVGVSLALPIDRVMRIARQLTSNGMLQRGRFGAVIQPVSSELAQAFGLQSAGGVVVLDVDSGGSADAAGLRSGDVVLAVEVEVEVEVGVGEPDTKAQTDQTPKRLTQDGNAASPAEIEDRISSAKPGTVLNLTVWRQRAMKHVRLKVAAAPKDSVPRVIPKGATTFPRLGLDLVQTKPSAQTPAGMYVENATGPSLLAGIESGDRIIAVNNLPVLTEAEFDAALRSFSRHESIALLVERERIRLYVVVHRDAP